jgi:lysozyme
MGFYGNPMADAFNPLLANSTARMGQELDAQTAKRKRFMDLVNQGITSAATLKQQDMSNNAAIEKATLDNQAAAELERVKNEQAIKLKELDQKSTSQTIDNMLKIEEWEMKTGLKMSPENKAKIMSGVALDTNNEGIKNVFSNQPQPATTPSVSVAAPTPDKAVPVSVSPTKINSRNIIKNYEGYKTTPYYDKDGYAVGYGSKRNLDGSPIDPGRKYTPEELQAMFERDVATTENAIDKMVKVPLSPVQKAALTSFVYNTSLGNETFGNSTLLKKLNAGDYQGAANEMDRWVHSKGKSGRLEPDPGLISRRSKEKELFLNAQPAPQAQWQPIPDSAPAQPASPQEAQSFAAGGYSGPFITSEIKAADDRVVQAQLAEVEKAKAVAAKDQAEARSQNMMTDIVGDTGSGAMFSPSTPEEAAALAAKSGLYTRRPLKDPYEELAFTNKADVALQGGPLAAQMDEPLKYRGANGKLVQYQPNEKLLADMKDDKMQLALAVSSGDKVALRQYYQERKDLTNGVSNLADFRTKAKELINILNPKDMKTNLRSDTLHYLAELANSGALKEDAIRTTLSKLPKEQQTKAVSAIFTMLGNLSAYARTKGEKGVISDIDIKRYSDLLVDMGSSPSVNREKLLNLVNDMSSLAANEFARKGMSSYANQYIEDANWARPQLGYSSWDYRDGVGQRQEYAGSGSYGFAQAGGGATAGGRRRL